MIFFRKKLISIALATLFFASGAHQLHAAKNSGPRFGLKKLIYLLALLQGASADQLNGETDIHLANVATDDDNGFSNEHTLLPAYEETQEKEELEQNKWKVCFERSKGKKEQKKCKLLLQNLLRNIEKEEEEERRNIFVERNKGREEQEKWNLLLQDIAEKRPSERTAQENMFLLFDWAMPLYNRTLQLYKRSKNKSHELATSAAANKTYEQIELAREKIGQLTNWLKKQMCSAGYCPSDDE